MRRKENRRLKELLATGMGNICSNLDHKHRRNKNSGQIIREKKMGKRGPKKQHSRQAPKTSFQCFHLRGRTQ